MDRDDTPALTRAIRIWESGRAISLVLFQALSAEGYDVPTLERRHRK